MCGSPSLHSLHEYEDVQRESDEESTMSRLQWVRGVMLTLAVIAGSMGCTASSATAIADADGMVTVTGVLTEIHDATPVDGGVTLAVALEGAATETLTFGSLFTYPPPGEERIALYQRIAEAEVGDRVRATGQRREAGIELVAFEILER